MRKSAPQKTTSNIESYRRILGIAAEASAVEGIRQGLEQADQGLGRPVAESFAEFEAKHGIPSDSSTLATAAGGS